MELLVKPDGHLITFRDNGHPWSHAERNDHGWVIIQDDELTEVEAHAILNHKHKIDLSRSGSVRDRIIEVPCGD